ncbi:MAG: type II and III secretion system protein family protein, partial [Sphingomonadales bacterium]|nr:type II and III secretion system protein family protein [Sphingomonadales bacterium]
QRATHEVLLSLGEGELVTLPVAVANVWTSNPDVADVYVDNARQIHLFGKNSGEATVFASTASGAVAYAAKIRVSQNISSIDKLVKMAMPDSDVTVTIVGQFAMLTGTVASPEDSAEVAKLVTIALNPGTKPGDEQGAKIGVINRLRTAVPLQVNLQVRIAEVSRSLARTIGTNLTSTANGGNGFQFGIGQGRTGFDTSYNPGQPLSVSSATSTGTITTLPNGTQITTPGTVVNPLAGGTTLAGAGKLLGLNILAALDLGETVGLVTTLAQPNLTAVSGETADFLAGGEFPIPLSQGLGAVSIDYKKYGVSLSFTPTVLADGRISLRVRPEVSELSSQGSITLNGFSVPALTVRRAETTVELGSGQSFMIAGLLSNNAQNTIQKMPGAGDLPILGALFKSTSFQKNETELVIVITPYLVTPVSDRDIHLPTDAIKSPNLVQEVLGNMVSDGQSGASRPLPTARTTTVVAPTTGAADAPAGAGAAGSGANAGGKPATRNAAGQANAPGFNLN